MHENNRLNEYEINSETLMVEPIIVGNKIFSNVLEVDDEFIVEKSPLHIVDHTCKYFGSSFEGRMKGSQSLLKIHHKVPIAIDYHMSLFLFPTTSPHREDCIWLSMDSIVDLRKLEYNCALVTFKNKRMKKINVSCSIIQNQMLRTAMLKNKLTQNFDELAKFEKKPLVENLVSESRAIYKSSRTKNNKNE